MSESKHGPHPGFDDLIKLKLWEIRHQLDVNVQTIMHAYPLPAPASKLVPHVIEILTDHVYDRLVELERLIESREGDGWHNFNQLQHITNHLCDFPEFDPARHGDDDPLGPAKNITDAIDAIAARKEATNG